MELQQLHPRVNGCRQTDVLHELMHQPDAAVGRAHRAVRHFVVEVSRPQHGTGLGGETALVEPARQTALAGPQLLPDNRAHSKSLRVAEVHG